jgi:hypothetical protein
LSEVFGVSVSSPDLLKELCPGIHSEAIRGLLAEANIDASTLPGWSAPPFPPMPKGMGNKPTFYARCLLPISTRENLRLTALPATRSPTSSGPCIRTAKAAALTFHASGRLYTQSYGDFLFLVIGRILYVMKLLLLLDAGFAGSLEAQICSVRPKG